MFEFLRESVEQCYSTAFCLNSRRRMPTKMWFLTIVLSTAATTFFMLLCVFTDQWEVTTYDTTQFMNETAPSVDSNQCTYTLFEPLGIDDHTGHYTGLLTTYNRTPTSSTNSDASCAGLAVPGRIQNISLVYPQHGSGFRLCLQMQDESWANISRLCTPYQVNRCLTYDTDSVKQPFCCIKCLYSAEQVADLDDNGHTSFEPIFTVIGFLIVSLIILCVCHLLALIAFWKRIVPVVMITGILFLVSGAFMAFCLAAHQYKVEIMNTQNRTLPNMTPDMIVNSKTEISWSVDVGWMGFAFSIFTGILWIRFSYHLASESSGTHKVRPTVMILHSNSVANANSNINIMTLEMAGSPKAPASPNTMTVPKTVRWAANPQPAGRETTSTIVPNSRPNSGSNLLPNEAPPSANGVIQHQPASVHPMMVEESV